MRKITGSKILLSTLLPSVVVGSFAVATSCSTSVIVSSKTPEVNASTGIAEFEAELPQQPADNEVMVHAVTTVGKNPILLIDEDGQPYDGHPSTFYKVENRKVKIRASFKNYTFDGDTTKFDLHFSYLNNKQEYVTCEANGLTLDLQYKHSDIEEIHIFDVNDFHGAAAGFGDDYFKTVNAKNPGAIRIANKILPTIESHPGSIFVTAGDNTSGETFSTCMHAKSMFPVLRAMGARYSAVGNHAFEWGLDPLTSGEFDELGRTADTVGNYLVTANVVTDPHKGPSEYQWTIDPNSSTFESDFRLWHSLLPGWADPYKIVNMNGHLVCLIGLTTQGAVIDGNKAVVEHLSFIDYEAAINYTNYLCQQEMGPTWYSAIESFILLTHVESDSDESGQPNGPAAEIVENLQYFGGVDAIISGHSHKQVCGRVYNPIFDKYIWVGQADNLGRRVLDTKLIFDNTKPVGKRLKNIDMDLVQCEVAKDYTTAKKELWEIRTQPSCESVRDVIVEYDKQKDLVKNKLFSPVAYRKDELAYPIVVECEQVGHYYYCSKQIVDQLGAWVNRAMMLGFSSYYQDDIKFQPNVTYPAISFFNIDSCNTQLPKPTQIPEPVTLKDVYAIQGYENPMYLGYLSVWQIALIVDYLLSGAKKFNYNNNNEYQEEDTTAPWFEGRNLRVNYHSTYLDGSKAGQPIDCWYPDQSWPTVEYKGGETRQCCYLCGPLQWYGFRFNVTPTDNTERGYYDREYKLTYHKPDATLYPDVAKTYSFVPDMWILDPMPETDKDLPYKDLDKPQNWKPAEYWLQKGTLIPCTINSFTYTKGNAQATMLYEYFMYNQKEVDDKIYKIANYSNLSREMIEEFCRLTCEKEFETILPFDLSNNIVKQLVTFLP